MAGRFGNKFCSHCGRDFELVRREQHLCCRECHDQFFIGERRRAMAAWRSQQREASFFVQPTQDDDEDNRVRRTG
jgi:DNA-directed RNA polymerase subunit RPC12/RpoP